MPSLVGLGFRVSPRNCNKVALPLSVIPHVLSLLILSSGRLHRSRQTRAKTLRHLGRDSSALGTRQTTAAAACATSSYSCTRYVRQVRYFSRMSSVLGRNVLFSCEHFAMSVDDLMG